MDNHAETSFLGSTNSVDAGVNSPIRGRRRVLFIGESVTLAHTGRPVTLAMGADFSRYDVFVACSRKYHHLLADAPFTLKTIESIPSERFLKSVAVGSPIFRLADLRRYVEDDLRLIEEVKPDIVIGDLRLSLEVSAPLSNTPHIAITNAYWSPYGRQRFPFPEHPLTKLVGNRFASLLYRCTRPAAFAYHTLPVNRIRREYGLPPLSYDLRKIYTHGDFTAYADIPELFPTFDLPDHHRYLGAVLWSPDCALPAWWDEIPPENPLVYVTLGSSGKADLLPKVLGALADFPVTVLAATAGLIDVENVPDNVRIAEYLPGQKAAQISTIVICNGGSPTTQQALVAGRPVVGLCSNMDQFLNMEAVQRAGAGEFLRAGEADVNTIRQTVRRVLDEPRYRESAARLAEQFAKYDAAARFWSLVEDVLIQQEPSPR